MEQETVFVAGASGFVGSRLLPVLRQAGKRVRAGSRRPRPPEAGVAWVRADLDDEASLERALAGCGSAVFLVHGLARGGDFGEWERASAARFARAAWTAGLRRLVYLGGLAPAGRPSAHLASRLEVGAILRAGRTPTVELRASMLIGPGSASWVVVRDLALRLPWMLVPRWVRHRTQPLAVEDALAALAAALEPAVPAPAIYDLPGPETVTMADLLVRVARKRGLKPRLLRVPVLSPRLSSYWLKLVTRADYPVARELVRGLASDVLARDASAWQVLGHPQLLPLDWAIDRALAGEPASASPAAARLQAWVGPLGHRTAGGEQGSGSG